MRWLASFRYIDGIDADRARQRWTLSYRFRPDFQAGIEWNPLADDIGPLANWTVLGETESRPALILGTSSDRIGSDRGQSYFGTLSKSVAPFGVALSPYVGLAFRDADNEWTELAGLQYWLWDEHLSVTHLWDGQNLHLTLDMPWRRSVFSLILAQQEDPSPGQGKDYFLGLGYGLRWPGLWGD